MSQSIRLIVACAPRIMALIGVLGKNLSTRNSSNASMKLAGTQSGASSSRLVSSASATTATDSPSMDAFSIEILTV